MKNLKKVLSLALAFAMVLGLCIGAMAADTKTQNVTTLKDWADVTNKDAAQLLNAFNIMQGDGNGNFRPADPVTRAEAAKMIAVALWGGDDLKDWFTGDSTTFTDVKSTDWFAGYVNYAATTGIVAGRNATTFDPQGKVTGYELLKMTLTALGYDQDEEGLVGAGWQVNTMRIAIGSRSQKNLTDDVEITNWDLPINREDTAQVIANMVYRTAVTYNNDGNLINVIDPSDSSKTLTFGTYYLGLKEQKAILVANTYGKATKIGETTLEKMPTAVKDNGENSVVVLLDSDNKVPVSPVDKSYKAVSTTSGLYDLGAYATLYSKDGKVISVAIDTPTKVDRAPGSTNVVTSPTQITIGTSGHPYETTLDTNADGKIDLITTVNYANLATVSDVAESEKFGTVYGYNYATWSTSYEKRGSVPANFLSNVVFADGNAAVKGDIIAYVDTTNAFTTAATANVTVAVVLDSIDGTIDRVVSGDTAYTYYIDGVAHKGAVQGQGTGYAFGAEGTFYFYPDGYIATVVGAAPSEDHYAVVYQVGRNTTGASSEIGGGAGTVVIQVAATLDNGETGIYNLDSITQGTTTTQISKLTSTAADALFSGTGLFAGVGNNYDGTKELLVKYSLSEDGKSIAIAEVTGTTPLNSYTASANSAKFDGASAKYFTSKTVTFMKTNANPETWAAYVGTPTFGYTTTNCTAVLSTLYGKENTGITAMMVTGSNVKDTTDKTAFVYILENKGQTGKDSTSAIFTMTVYDAVADAVGDIEVKGDADVLKTYKAGDFFNSYTASSKTLGDKITMTSGYKFGFVTTCGDGVVALTKLGTDADSNVTTKVYTYDTNTKFYLIDGEDSGVITAADVIAQTPDGYENEVYGSNYYQAIIQTGTTNVQKVILFGERQKSAK